MIACSTVRKQDIRSHYNLTTLFYRLLWGRHIHHGLWTGEESASAAQQHLTETLAAEAGIQPGQRVLDVGCGMGSSSIHLATKLRLRSNRRHHQLGATTVGAACGDWPPRSRGTRNFFAPMPSKSRFPQHSFDIVWSIECTEHLFDKPQFFRRVAGWLKSGRSGGNLCVAFHAAIPIDRRPSRCTRSARDFFVRRWAHRKITCSGWPMPG